MGVMGASSCRRADGGRSAAGERRRRSGGVAVAAAALEIYLCLAVVQYRDRHQAALSTSVKLDKAGGNHPEDDDASPDPTFLPTGRRRQTLSSGRDAPLSAVFIGFVDFLGLLEIIRL